MIQPPLPGIEVRLACYVCDRDDCDGITPDELDELAA